MSQGQEEPIDERQQAIDAYVKRIMDSVAQIRLPALLDEQRQWPEALYRVSNRHGVGVLAIPTTALQEAELIELMRYRMAQYLAVGFIDPGQAYDAQLEYESIAGVKPGDLHLIAGAVATGEILCYGVIEAPIEAPVGTLVRDRDRPLFPVEEVHGWGIYNRLRFLPDLPVSKIREMGRFAKNQQKSMLDELATRGPVEVSVATFRLLAGPLRLEVEALIGDLEEQVVAQNLEFFHVPKQLIYGTIPYLPPNHFLARRYHFANVYPFALLGADCSREMIDRLAAIEAALDLPGKQAIIALLQLKRSPAAPHSSLAPTEGLPTVTTTRLTQRGVSMTEREQLLDSARALQETQLLGGVSQAEAAVIQQFMTMEALAAGAVVVRQGDIGDALYLIDEGEAEVRITDLSGKERAIATLKPGEYFGEIALVTQSRRTADVVAKTPLRLWRMDREAYMQYLQSLENVDAGITQVAVARATDTVRKLLTGES